MGSGAKTYMRKGFLIYEEMRKFFPIYEEADHSEFPYIYEENFLSFLISVVRTQIRSAFDCYHWVTLMST